MQISAYRKPDRKDGRLLVVALSGGAEVYRDTIDADSAYERQKFIDAAGSRKGKLMDEDEAPYYNACSETGCDLDYHKVIIDAAEQAYEESLNGKPHGESVTTVTPFQFQRLTCQELDAAAFATEFLIEWTLVAGQPCIFAGSKKTLKTTLLVALALSLATGKDYLGKLKVLRCARVLVMSGESGISTLQETARRIAATLGEKPKPLSDIEGLFWCDKLPQFSNLEHGDALEVLLKADEIEVLVVDPAYLCMSGEGAENLFKQGVVLRAFNEICQRNGVTLIIAHHTKRSVADPFACPELEDIAWAGFQEWCRQWLLVGRRERYEPGTGRHRLWLNVGGSAGHSALWAIDCDEGTLPRRHWLVNVMHADEAREQVEERRADDKQAKVDAKVENAKRQLVKAMGKYPKGETERTIKDTAGVGGTLAKLAFAALLQDGDAVPVDVFKSNHKTPYQGYKLCDRQA